MTAFGTVRYISIYALVEFMATIICYYVRFVLLRFTKELLIMSIVFVFKYISYLTNWEFLYIDFCLLTPMFIFCKYNLRPAAYIFFSSNQFIIGYGEELKLQ
jgi:hypothetical protein